MKNAPNTTTTTTTTTVKNPSKFAKAAGVVLSIALVSGIAYLLYNLVKRQPKSVKATATDLRDAIRVAPSEIKAAVTGKYLSCNFPLKKGCGGDNVTKLQKFLNKEGQYNLVEDGKFGDLTENAVIDNQNPFTAWKAMYPKAIKGQVSKEFFDLFMQNA
jgi:hypothetical protein